MYINAVQREKSIGGFVRDEIMIAMGDTVWAKNTKKVHFLAGCSLKWAFGIMSVAQCNL